VEIYHINPFLRTMLRSDIAGSPEQIARVFGMRGVQSQEFNDLGDRLYISTDSLIREEHATFYFYCGSCNMMHGVQGHAFITGPKESPSPIINLPISRLMIRWTSDPGQYLLEVMNDTKQREAMWEKAFHEVMGGKTN